MKRGRSLESIQAYTLLLPAILLLVGLRLYPTIFAIVTSFQKRGMSIFDPPRWAGFSNYEYLLFRSPTFMTSLATTLVFVAVVTILQTILALALAVIYTQKGYGIPLWRTIVFLPIAIPVAVSTVIWEIAMRDDGIINAVIDAFTGSTVSFFSTGAAATASFFVILSWVGTGYWMTILIAGLNDIPREVKEAAAIDGAKPVRTFFEITLPLLRRPLAFVVVAHTVGNFFTFVPVAIITHGGPQGATRYLMYEIYAEAYVNANENLASAAIVLFSLMIIAIVAVQFRLVAPPEGRRA